MKINLATLKDTVLIQSLAQEIWRYTYKDILSMEQMDYMLDKMYSQKVLEGQILDNEHTFLIMEDEGKAIGFAAYSCIDSSTESYKLHKIYLKSNVQGKGFGKKLVNEIVTQIKVLGGKTLQLNVNRDNSARYFYEKMLFRVVQEVDVPIGNNYFMNDYIMERTI